MTLQQRLLAEKSDLDEKLDKLQEYLEAGRHRSLELEDQLLLELQHCHMAAYSCVLARRIDRL